jgi:hypothetical protein
MGQTYVSQRYLLPLSTRSFRWFALWPHFACISFPYDYAFVSEAETLMCARKNSSAKSVYYVNLCSNVVGLATEDYLLYIWNVAFVLSRQDKYSPTPYKPELNVRIMHLYFGTIHSLDLLILPCFK